MFMALVLGLVSCQNEPDEMNVSLGGEEQIVTVNVAVQETETRAVELGSDKGVFNTTILEEANTTMRYILQVYYKNGENFVKSDERKVEYSDGRSVAFDVRLVPGRDYQFVVWADVVVNGEQDTDNHYNTSDLKEIKLNNTWVAMDESRDAFTATEFIDNFNSSKNINITLKRPFAKLRVVTTDMTALNNLGIEPKTATVTYTEPHYGAFNAFAGKSIGDSKNRNIKHENFAIASYGETGDNKTLFTDYFFAEDDATNFILEVFDQDNKIIKSGEFTTDIYVKRNNLTTIKGNILTDGNSFDVTIEDGFAGESGKDDGKTFANVDTAEELLDAINKGVENITLDGNIDLGSLTTRAAASDVLTVAAGKNITLDLNGKTISYTKACESSYAMIANNGRLTINDSVGGGKISFKDTGAGDPTFGWGSYTIQNNNTLVVNGGTIEHLGEQNSATEVKHMICAIFQYSGSTTINGGTISTPTYRSARLWHGDMTINGGNFEGQVWVQAVDDSSNLTINGGTFAPRGADGSSIFITNSEYEVNAAVNDGFFNTKIGCSNASKAGVKGCIVGGTFTAAAIDNTNPALIAHGYMAEEENGVFVVRKPQSLIDFENAIANGGNIQLTEDITLIEALNVPAGKEVVLDLNGKTLTADLSGYVLNNEEGGSLTISNGTITGVVYTGENSNTTINSGTFNAVEGGKYVFLNYSGTLTINGGTINGGTSYPVYSYESGSKLVINDATVNATFGCINSYGTGAEVEVNGGTFEMTGVQGKTSHIAYFANGDVTINGGTFSKKGDINMSATGGGGVCAIYGANLTINGGNFAGDYADVYNWGGQNADGRSVAISIKGGSYKFEPNATFVADGYKVIEEDGKYNVVLGTVDDVVSSTETLKDAVDAGNDTIALTSGTYNATSITNIAGKTISFVGNGEDTVFDYSSQGYNSYVSGGDGNFTFENMTITRSTETFAGMAHTNSTVYKNCVINGVYFVYEKNAQFIDCTFNVTGNYYNCWLYGTSKATYTNCTFNCDGKSIYVDGNGDAGSDAEFNNCVFNDIDKVVTDKAAIETGTTYGKRYKLIINDATVNGFNINPNGIVTGTALWANKHSMTADKLEVIIDGYTWVADGVTLDENGNYLISKASGLTWFSDQINNKKNTFAGKTIKVVNDIDMAGATYYGGSAASYPSYCFKGTFDGGEKVISNLTITVENDVHGAAALIPTLAGDGTTIKNVTLKNVNISSSHYAGGIWGYTTNDNCYINVTNCHVEGGTITGNIYNGDNADKVGGIGGIFYTGVVSNCSVKGVTISGYRDIAGLVGWAADINATIKNNEIENVTINVNNTTNYKKYTNRAQYDVNSYVGEGVGTAKIEGNTGEATINWGSIAE